MRGNPCRKLLTLLGGMQKKGDRVSAATGRKRSSSGKRKQADFFLCTNLSYNNTHYINFIPHILLRRPFSNSAIFSLQNLSLNACISRGPIFLESKSKLQGSRKQASTKQFNGIKGNPSRRVASRTYVTRVRAHQ